MTAIIRRLAEAYQQAALAYSAGWLAMDALAEMNESNKPAQR